MQSSSQRVLGQVGASRVSASHPTRYIAAVLCFPLILLLVNNSWVFFPPTGMIDPYVYTGYFLDLKHRLSVFPEVYYGTRLPWILLGYSIHAIASPEVAQYMLRLILYYVSALSLFAIVRMLFVSNLAATMATFVLGTNTYFLWSIGWDYVDGIGVALIFLTTACLTAAATGTAWRRWLFWAGFACVSMVSTYLVLILLAPFQVAAYLLTNLMHRRHPLGASLAWFGLGAGSGIAILGTANWMLAGQFLFFMPQVRMALLVGNARSQWKLLNYDWISIAGWLVFPTTALVIALVLLGVWIHARWKGSGTTDAYRDAALFALLLVGLETLFLTMELNGFWLLQVSYYASYLIPNVFICLGAAIAFGTSRTSRQWDVVIVAATAASLLLPFLIASHQLLHLPFKIAEPAGWVAAGGCLLLAAATLWKRAWLTVVALFVLGLFDVSVHDSRIFSIPPSSTDQARHLMVFDGIRAVRPYNLDGKLLFWYDLQDPLGPVFRAVASAYMWASRMISEDFPNRTFPLPGTTVELGAGETVAILSSKSEPLLRADESLARIGTRQETIGHADVQRGADRFTVDFVRVLPRNSEKDWQLSLNTVTPVAATLFSKTPAGDVVVRTTAVPWTYAATLTITPANRDQSKECRALIKVRLHVRDGVVGLGVLNLGRKNFLSRQSLAGTSNPVDIMMQIPRLGDASDVVIQAWDSGKVGLVSISAVTVSPYACPSVK